MAVHSLAISGKNVMPKSASTISTSVSMLLAASMRRELRRKAVAFLAVRLQRSS